MIDITKSQAQLEAEANAINFDDDFMEIFEALYPESKFEILNITGKTGFELYNSIRPYKGDFIYDAKLDYYSKVVPFVSAYKQKKLDNISRVFRGLALWDWYKAKSVVSDYDNIELQNEFLERLELEDNFVNIVALETQDSFNKAEYDEELDINEKVYSIKLGRRIIATINKMNEDLSITVAQSQAIFLDADMDLAIKALNAGALETARDIILAKDISGLPPLSQAHKDKVESIVNGYLGA